MKNYLELIEDEVISLEDVPAEDQTEEICLRAVELFPWDLKFVANQTDKICLEAVERNGLVLKYVKNQTEEICLAAINENYCALGDVENKTEKICLAAVKRNGYALRYVPAHLQTEEICKEALEYRNVLNHLANKTKEICEYAFRCTSKALIYMPKEFITYEMCQKFISENMQYSLSEYFECIPEEFRTLELCLDAVRKNSFCLQYIPAKHKTYEVCLVAATKNIKSCELIDDLKMREEILREIEEDKKAVESIIGYIRNDYSLISKIQDKRLFEMVIDALTAEGEIV